MVVFALMAFIAVETADAKSRSGSRSFSSKSFSSKSSNKSTSGWLSSKSKPTPKRVAPKPTQKKITAQSNKTTKGFASSKKSTTPNTKSTAPKTAIDNKMAKKNALQSKNNAAGKKYGSKKNAEAAYRKNMTSSNKYTSKTPPATRPANIPQNVTSGGRSVNVTYNVLPGGGYGYGYRDPLTGTFMAMTAAYMIADAAMMNRHGYGAYDQYGNPVYRQPAQAVVYRDSTPMSTGGKFIVGMVVVGILGLITFALYKST